MVLIVIALERSGGPTARYVAIESGKPAEDPKGSPDRVARGGSFALGVAFLRSAYRSHVPPDVSGCTLGLRPASRITR